MSAVPQNQREVWRQRPLQPLAALILKRPSREGKGFQLSETGVLAAWEGGISFSDQMEEEVSVAWTQEGCPCW